MCDVTPESTTTVPASLGAPALAREFVETHSCPVHGATADVAAQLLASELVTNAVLYGAPPITLHLSCSGYALHLEVRDRERADGRAPEADGLGMLLVDKVANDWGATRAAGVRTVWCTVRTGVVPRQHGGRPAVTLSAPAGAVGSSARARSVTAVRPH